MSAAAMLKKVKGPKAPEVRILLPAKSLRARRLKKYMQKYCLVPEGMLVGKSMELLPEQDDFLERVYGNTDASGRLITRTGILSVARKNGKTGFIAPILSGHLIGPEAKQNSMMYSAARSRDQAALIFNYLAKSLRMRNDLEGLVQITDSSKKVRGLAANTEYRALSADATTSYGVSPSLTVHDELGQVVGPTDKLFDALETSGGAQEEPLSLIISTQAAGDADLLSTLIDDAIRNPTPENVVCLYTTEKDIDIFLEKNWYAANFALGKFRSMKELADAAQKARRLPAFEATFRNLYMNQRISLLQLLVAPSTWKACNGTVDQSLFRSGVQVHIGADLSQSRDLTSVVLSAQDPDTEVVHLKVYTFTPLEGLELRAQQDRAPYVEWVKRGQMIALPGKNINYNMVAAHMAKECEGMNLASMQFDRWRIELFRKACEEEGFAVSPSIVWAPVGQGFKDMSPRIEAFEGLLIDELIAHGADPTLNMAAANAVVVMDPVKNKKLEKAKSSARIDPMVAAIMSVYGIVGPTPEKEGKPPVTDKSFFFV
jgi:phage terminase large subunit-like protein